MTLFQDDHILLLTVALVAAETPEEVKKPLKKKHKSPFGKLNETIEVSVLWSRKCLVRSGTQTQI